MGINQTANRGFPTVHALPELPVEMAAHSMILRNPTRPDQGTLVVHQPVVSKILFHLKEL